MSTNKFLKFLLVTTLISLFPFQNALANEERRIEPDEMERSSYSFQAYQRDKWYFDALDTPSSNNLGANVTIAILDSGVTQTSQLSCHNFVNDYDAFWNISGSDADVGQTQRRCAHHQSASVAAPSCCRDLAR